MRPMVIVACALALARAVDVRAQIPQQFENLQVLPRDITRDSLVSVMRSFSLGLGVRCVHCHVGEDTPSLAGVDFRSDDKPAKRIAREMMKLTATVNQTIAALPDRGSAGPLTVRCFTCHRGVRRPGSPDDTIGVPRPRGLAPTMAR